MRKRVLLLNVLAAGLIIAAASFQAQAQSNRTWVSSTGSDANDCSRISTGPGIGPCATFSGAFAKTNPSGEINVVDSGAYGNVVITRAVTIDGGETTSLITSGGFTAISVTVTAGPTDTVILRRLNMNGLLQGDSGIKFNSGKELHVESCVIKNFQGHGINFAPTTSANLYVRDTTVTACLDGAGIRIKPGTSGITRADITGTTLQRNLYGVFMELPGGGTGVATISKTVASCEGIVGGSLSISPFAFWVNDFGLEMNIIDSVGTHCNQGVRVINGIARVSNNLFSFNTTALAANAPLGNIFSTGNNTLFGNTSDGFAPTLIPLK